MNLHARLREVVKEQKFPVVFVTISGAHLYGFPSPDSDYDLRGVHVLPVSDVVGLDPVKYMVVHRAYARRSEVSISREPGVDDTEICTVHGPSDLCEGSRRFRGLSRERLLLLD